MITATKLIITANIHESRSYEWDHFEELIDRYRMFKKDDVYICGSGFCPDYIKENYHMSWSDSLKEQGQGFSAMIDSLGTVLNHSQLDGETYVLICPLLQWLENLSELSNLTISYTHKDKTGIYGADIFYGKASTLKKIFTNRKWDDTLTDQKNMLLNITNVVGTAMLEHVLVSSGDLKVFKRHIISRDYWEDLRC